jgi:predicted DNA-binding transcriptional regulator AlpA
MQPRFLTDSGPDLAPPADPRPAGAGAPPKRRRHRVQPIVADAKLLARLLGVGVRSIRTWASAGKLPAPVPLGSRVVWPIHEIRAWHDAGAPDRETWELLKKRKWKGAP